MHRSVVAELHHGLARRRRPSTREPGSGGAERADPDRRAGPAAAAAVVTGHSHRSRLRTRSSDAASTSSIGAGGGRCAGLAARPRGRAAGAAMVVGAVGRRRSDRRCGGPAPRAATVGGRAGSRRVDSARRRRVAARRGRRQGGWRRCGRDGRRWKGRAPSRSRGDPAAPRSWPVPPPLPKRQPSTAPSLT